MKTLFSSLLIILMFLLNTQVQAAGISKQEAVNIATQQHPGRVLAVKLKANIYQIKTLNNSGKVQVIRIDASTGKIQTGSRDDLKSPQ